MTISADELRLLSNAGLTADQLVAVTEILQTRAKDCIADREKSRIRMQNSRERRRLEQTALRNSRATVTQPNATVASTPSPSPMVAPSPPLQSSPPPPLNPSPAPTPEGPQASDSNLFGEQQQLEPKTNWHPEDFEELWLTFPKHTGSRVVALNSYKKARKKGFTHAQIIGNVAPYIAWLQRKPDGFQFVAHLATWLNQQRFLIDYSPPVAQLGGGPGRILSDGSARGDAFDATLRALDKAAARFGD